MGMAVIVDGKVVYGDAAELKNVQLVEVSKEIERLSVDVQRLMAALDVAKEALGALSREMGEGRFHSPGDLEKYVGAQEPPQLTPVQTEYEIPKDNKGYATPRDRHH